jgi:hypothetical protein
MPKIILYILLYLIVAVLLLPKIGRILNENQKLYPLALKDKAD